MSPNVANSLVHDLVEMAKAMEQLPQVQEQLESARIESAQLRDIIQRLELQAIDRKNELDAAHAQVRSLEVERDTAQFQVLEEQDKADKALAFVRSFREKAGALLAANEPQSEPIPEPTPAPMASMKELGEDIAHSYPSDAPIATFSGSPANIDSVGSSAADPTPVPADPIGTGMEPVQSSYSTPEVVPTLDPTQDTATSSKNASPASIESVSLRKGTYEGRLYKEWPTYVSLTQWLAGGGDEPSYYAV